MRLKRSHDNYKKLIRQLSVKINVDYRIIDDVIRHTGRWLHNSCENLESKTYLWRKFGRFDIKKTELNKLNKLNNENNEI